MSKRRNKLKGLFTPNMHCNFCSFNPNLLGLGILLQKNKPKPYCLE